jgi:hypothetical protein
MEGFVEAEPRIDVAREFVRLGYDSLKSRANERVTVCLAASESARIAPQEWQVRSEFLT